MEMMSEKELRIKLDEMFPHGYCVMYPNEKGDLKFITVDKGESDWLTKYRSLLMC